MHEPSRNESDVGIGSKLRYSSTLRENSSVSILRAVCEGRLRGSKSIPSSKLGFEADGRVLSYAH